MLHVVDIMDVVLNLVKLVLSLDLMEFVRTQLLLHNINLLLNIDLNFV